MKQIAETSHSTAVPQRTYLTGFRRMVLLYLVLLLGEGALRKWILPEFSNLLLIVRDLLVLLIYAWAAVHGRLTLSRWVWFGAAVTTLSFAFTLGHEDLPVWVPVYGFRICMLHVPLIFLMATSLDRRDVESMGRFFLWCAPVMTVLMALQFNASATSWLNVGAGGMVDSQLRGALGRIRAAGSFTFTSGPALFYPGVAAFALYGWLTPNRFNRLLLLVVSISLTVAIPISISRGLMFGVGITVMAAGLSLMVTQTNWWRLSVPLIVGPIVLYAVGGIDILMDGVAAFQQRWTEASSYSTGVLQSTLGRFFGQFGEAWEALSVAPAFGNGLGLGSNVGSVLTTGERGFLLAETEWARILLEMGPFLGTLFIIMRVGIGVRLCRAAWIGLRENNLLPLLLASAGVLPVIVGQWSPPTILGFSVVYAGLTLAALNPPEDADETSTTTPASTGSTPTDP